ncbi:MAG: PAS domain-containing protein, partial [Candidatus Sericytochromatia bacterium]
HLGSWQLDLETQVATWSAELYRIFGLSPQDGPITIERFRETLHPEDRERALGLVARAVEAGGPFSYQARFLRPDGTHRVLDTRGEVLLGPDGEVRVAMGACLDVTERQSQAEAVARHVEALQSVNEELAAQAEELAHQQEALHRTNQALASQGKLLTGVLEHVPGGIGYADRDLVVRMVNAQFAASYQRRPEDFLGKTFAEAFPESRFPGLAARAEAPLRHVLETREPWRSLNYPVTIEGPDGRKQERFRDAVVVPVTDDSGAVEGLLSLSFDSTDRVMAERELARSAQALAAQVALTDRIIRHAPVVMAYVDRNLHYQWNNGVHSQLVGKPPAEVIGRHLAEVLPAETYARTEPLYRQVLESGEPFHTRSFPARMHGHEGLVYLDMSYVPILDDAQAAQGLLIIAIDVTDRVERERLQAATIEALKQADRTKDEFLSVISHELRTPLNFIMGFASTLEDEVQGPLNPAQREAIGKIMSGADRMVLLVDDLLDFARMQAGTFHLDAAATPFASLVEEVATTMRPLAAQKGLSIDTDVQGAFTPTLDGHRIVQVLTNLVSNAIKFTERGHVSVRVRSRDGELLTEVVDTGSGIAPQDIPRLFQRFQQLDMSQTRRVGGTGLGLAISKAIVEAHGGTIGVESEPGTGSTFWFALPL